MGWFRIGQETTRIGQDPNKEISIELLGGKTGSRVDGGKWAKKNKIARGVLAVLSVCQTKEMLSWFLLSGFQVGVGQEKKKRPFIKANPFPICFRNSK